MGSVSHSENIIVRFNVNGPGCNHIVISSTGSAVNGWYIYGVYEEGELRSPITIEDGKDILLVQIKTLLKQAALRGATKIQTENFLENADIEIVPEMIRNLYKP